MQLRKDSYFYKFLTLFDDHVFVEYVKEYDTDGDWDWKRVDHRSSGTYAQGRCR